MIYTQNHPELAQISRDFDTQILSMNKILRENNCSQEEREYSHQVIRFDTFSKLARVRYSLGDHGEVQWALGHAKEILKSLGNYLMPRRQLETFNTFSRRLNDLETEVQAK